MWLMWRGLVEARVCLACAAAALAWLCVLPVDGVWCAPVAGGGFASATAIAYAACASSLGVIAGLVAPLWGVRPTRAGTQVVWAALLGVLCALAIRYVSPEFGPPLALLVAAPVARVIESGRSRGVM